MSTWRRRILAYGTRVLDQVVLATALLAAIAVRVQRSPFDLLSDWSTTQIHSIDVIAVILLVLAWNRSFSFFGLYQKRRLDSHWREGLDFFKAVTLATIFLTAFL